MSPDIHIPDDVWYVVADILEAEGFHSELMGFVSLNRAFYNMALNTRYREVCWGSMDKRTIKLLIRLQDPSIAHRVRRLHIRAWFINYLLKRKALFKMAPGDMIKGWITTQLKAIRVLDKDEDTAISPNVNPKECFVKDKSGRIISLEENGLPAPKDILKLMISAIKGMTKVVEYNFEWRDLPFNNDTRSFLASANTAFSSSLRKLALHAEIPRLQQFLEATDSDALEELDLQFDYSTTATSSLSMSSPHYLIKVLQDSVASFINKCSKSLRRLNITSFADVDLSPFFGTLKKIPSLRHLYLQINFDQEHLSDSSSIVRFLAAHSSSLSHVKFNPILPSDVYPRSLMIDSTRRAWVRVNQDLLNVPIALANLESLEMPLPIHIDNINILARSADTMTSLCLLNRFMDYTEAADLVKVFSHRPLGLKDLRIEITHINADFIHLLGNNLLGLESLILIYKFSYYENNTVTFKDAIAKHQYPDWKLRNIGIYEQRYHEDPMLSWGNLTTETTFMAGIANSVPSITMFRGMPKEVFISRWIAVDAETNMLL